MYGPTGTGVLYSKEKWLEAMPPYELGGSMIRHVAFEKTCFNELPYKFEAGTPNIAGIIGLGAALDYFSNLEPYTIIQHEHYLLEYATKQLSHIPEICILGTSKHKVPIISFTIRNKLPQDIGKALSNRGIAIRVGFNCAMPLLDHYGLTDGVCRISIGLYNTIEEIDTLIHALDEIATGA